MFSVAIATVRHSNVPAIRARQKKFTPENIARIKAWLTQGVSRDEIANRLEVTVGSLPVTCSRLGISLRKSSILKGSGLRPIGVVQRYIENIHEADHPARPKFTLLIQKQGRQGAFDLPLSHDLIKRLAFEAAFHGQPISDLIGKIVIKIASSSLVADLLDEC